jgi:hypothetical protein
LETILKFAKELLPLLELYPGWAKLLFGVSALTCAASVTTFIVLYQGAERRLREQTVQSELSVSLGVLTQHEQTANERPADAALESSDQGRDGIKLSIAQPTPAESQGGENVSYVLDKMDGGFRIRPSVGYLSKLEAGGPIADLAFLYSPFDPAFPLVDLKVVNNSSKTIFFTNAVFEVEQSRMDPTPIPVIPADKFAANAQHIELINDGWGNIDECFLKFNLVADGQPTSYDGPFQNEVKVGPFVESINVDISSAFEKAGVNNAAIKGLQWTEKSGDSITVVGTAGRQRTLSREQYRREQLNAFGQFPDNIAVAQGEIVYSGGGQPQRRVKFSTHVYVMNEDRVGVPAPPTAQYDVFFKVEGSDYTVDVPISQAIKTGEADRFTFRIGAAKSSLHRFRLKLLYNGGEILSTTMVDLLIFMPRSTVQMFERASKTRKVTP